ncbi:ABC-type Mn2+/Zn2+ transport system, periplasmic solute binding protein [Sulfurimonas gotlandica GD1]|uniref:ABC-type Mn2+/Zn2+ transport system, periplasmic solute binding protein n=1 Tax=Sulfurimonas gotlandica (strain DSM 19862 / JCM 16533 / GD1) TaxID=929558 RepID=B6BGV6_SULGG|nr:metal ABC transporter substrate-binding protein [Sulfurimonas gotlandica]EDZ63120.1 periplasmic solute binding protein [Sulfurimonas gotlandica GD1]EHP29740.1 ABC-type Mn2+/Zn2+ transport system, periplasmic solute binding protein [Sulfurimonas gotlandica GD1]
MKDFRNIIFVLVVAIFLLQMYVSEQDAKVEIKNKKPAVALSTFALYDIAKNISQNTLDLVMILPFGVDAHSFEPTPKLMAKIMGSDLVVYSGAGLEPWTASFDFKSKTIDMSKSVKLLEPKDEHEEHAHHDHGHDAVDPHYWLDIQNMISATKLMSVEFIKLSPENEELYKVNTQKYIVKLESIDAKYKKSLSNCKKETIIVNHNAFSYLSNNYGFHIEALSGLSPDAQPSAKNMVRLIEHVKEHDVKIVFFESFVSDKAMKSIAQEAQVSVDVLQPLGNITADEAKKNLSYEDIMLDNLVKISKALACE